MSLVNKYGSSAAGLSSSSTKNPSNLYMGYTPEQWQEFGANKGTLDQNYGIVGGTDSAIGIDASTGTFGSNLAAGDYAFDGSQDAGASFLKNADWGMKGLGGTALGAGQLGLGVLSYLDQSKTADKQRQLMDQQMAQNTFVLNNAKGRQADIAATFGKA